MDIHVLVNIFIGSCQKGIHWPVSPDCIMGSGVQLIEVMCFLNLSVDQF